MNRILIILIVFLPSSLIIAQSIPKNQFLYQSKKLLYDVGRDWESLTVFGPIRYESNSKQKFKFPNLADIKLGSTFKNNSYALNGFARLKYMNYFYAYLYPVVQNNLSESNQLNTESKFSDTYGNLSGLGFENDWLIFQFGKGRESWGAGNNIQLALSENSHNYDYFLLGFNHRKIRFRYIHGFLENVEGNINRFITARGFEWTNKKSLVIGFSETIIYSGENRSIDIGYLNPISSHLEVELNNRLNIIGNSNSNAVWQMHIDYLLTKHFRVSINYLYDELVIDPNIEIGKESGRAFSYRFSYTPVSSINHLFTLYGSLVYVGTPTFRHGFGMNNFVQNGRPLGWYRGSDGQDFCIGANYFNDNNLIVSISTGIHQSGEETITERIFDSYADYLKGKFPSGKVEENYYIKSKIIYLLKKKYSISTTFQTYQNIKVFDFRLVIPISHLFKK